MALEQITKESIAEIVKQSILDKVYPVGSVYVSVNNVSPEDFLGGKWQKIEDKFLFSSGKYTVGSTGGEETVQLQVSQMPAHTHGKKELNGHAKLSANVPVRYNGAGATLINSTDGIVSSYKENVDEFYYTSSTKSTNFTGYNGFQINATHEHDSVGNGNAHNNMPPYVVVYMWKRTE